MASAYSAQKGMRNLLFSAWKDEGFKLINLKGGMEHSPKRELAPENFPEHYFFSMRNSYVMDLAQWGWTPEE